MGRFENHHIDRDIDSWYFVPMSTGWGSASDQQGMNKIIKNFDWYFSRKGGVAKYLTREEYTSGR
jgi:hypothetical protein